MQNFFINAPSAATCLNLKIRKPLTAPSAGIPARQIPARWWTVPMRIIKMKKAG